MYEVTFLFQVWQGLYPYPHVDNEATEGMFTELGLIRRLGEQLEILPKGYRLVASILTPTLEEN